MKIEVRPFFDADTFTLTYVVFDDNSKDAIIIDPVLDYDPASGLIEKKSIQLLKDFIDSKNLNVHYILETHAHADHITGAMALKKNLPDVKIAIGKHIIKVQKLFGRVFNLDDLDVRGNQFDHLIEDGELLEAGTIKFKTLHTPGHTPACVSYLIEDMVFVGDLIFMPDFGTGRCDFPAGSAKDLYQSIKEKIYTLSDETKIYVGHDYQPGGRNLMYQTTVAESKANNIQLSGEISEEDFVKFRTERDATLSAPRLLLPSIQVNIDGGKLPTPEANEVSYLKIPIKEGL